jgi:hypothetical protein
LDISDNSPRRDLPTWINTLVGNTKKFTDGTYHGREEHKQLYMEEFVYRFNRRRIRSSLVNRLLNTCVQSTPHPFISTRGVQQGVACESL